MHDFPISRRALIAAAAVLAAGPLCAQTPYPNKPIRVVVGYAAGGSVDLVGRVVGDILARHLNATVVVDNVPGAAGVVAAQRVVGTKADGYILLAGSSNELAGTKFVNAAQKYDPATDLTAIALTGVLPNLWVAGLPGAGGHHRRLRRMLQCSVLGTPGATKPKKSPRPQSRGLNPPIEEVEETNGAMQCEDASQSAVHLKRFG
jgi:hypothetical protein